MLAAVGTKVPFFNLLVGWIWFDSSRQLDGVSEALIEPTEVAVR